MAMSTRRRWLGQALGMAGIVASGACTTSPDDPIRIGAQPFPGYELIYLARTLGLLPADAVRLIEAPSASANLRALAAGAMEGAGMTLDEVLTAREQGIDLVVICIVDRSVGADAVIGGPAVRALADLKGRRIGVEQTATGAVMLDATLQAAGLRPADVELVPLTYDAHEARFRDGAVDALVTYAPVMTRLLSAGATKLYDSASIPGRIMDTFALRRDSLQANAAKAAVLIDRHFKARAAWLSDPARHAAAIAPRLKLAAPDVVSAFAGLELPDRAANRQLFADGAAALLTAAHTLGQVMMSAGLLQQRPDVGGLFHGGFV